MEIQYNTYRDRVWVNPFSLHYTWEEKMFFLARFGALGCFVGHGCWGLLQKTGWLKFLLHFGIAEETAWQLMPLIGFIDIMIGLLIFLKPRPIYLWWALTWTIFTALLRPMTGMGMSEFFERAGNYGIPLAMLIMYNWPLSRNKILQPITSQSFNHHTVEKVLRISLFLLLAGHAGLAMFQVHPVLFKHTQFLGIHQSDVALLSFGIFEMLLALFVLFRASFPGLMLFVLGFKIATEILHPLSGGILDSLETIERMGDYVIPVMLWLMYQSPNLQSKKHSKS